MIIMIVMIMIVIGFTIGLRSPLTACAQVHMSLDITIIVDSYELEYSTCVCRKTSNRCGFISFLLTIIMAIIAIIIIISYCIDTYERQRTVCS